MSYTKFYDPAADDDGSTPVNAAWGNHVEQGVFDAAADADAAQVTADAAIADPGGQTEGDALQISSGVPAWIALPAGVPAGFGGMWYSDTAPTGWAILDGSTITGADVSNPELYANVDTTWISGSDIILPDMRGRSPVGVGTHADVNALGDSDGISTVANRRPKHKHTAAVGTLATGNDTPDHTHSKTIDATGGANNAFASGDGSTHNGTGVTGGASARHTHPVTGAPTVGPQTGAEPTDGAAYLAVNFIIKL